MGMDEAHYTGKDNGPVPAQEDRIAALERKVAMLELLRSQDERKAEEAISPAQARNMREINENLTILLGVTSSQGGDIKVIKEDVSSIKDRLDRLETQSNEQTVLLNEQSGRFDHVEALLTHILARLPEKP
jgi:chromosome segregation ATPase